MYNFQLWVTDNLVNLVDFTEFTELRVYLSLDCSRSSHFLLVFDSCFSQ